jgi:hypothetical protein
MKKYIFSSCFWFFSVKKLRRQNNKKAHFCIHKNARTGVILLTPCLYQPEKRGALGKIEKSTLVAPAPTNTGHPPFEFTQSLFLDVAPTIKTLTTYSLFSPQHF